MTAVHSSYAEVPQAELAEVGRYRDTDRIVRMRADAAAALIDLLAQARAAGVPMVPISGFRSLEYQAGLVQKAIVKYGSEEVAGRWVARPGYSEHHTGLAVDLGPEEAPDLDCETSFEETPAFAWLNQNAGRFGFELSYPRGNARGINYEPWHWRFVGTPSARQILES
jgi:LAS superfamily LD-carboxypeptidase LdcB